MFGIAKGRVDFERRLNGPPTANLQPFGRDESHIFYGRMNETGPTGGAYLLDFRPKSEGAKGRVLLPEIIENESYPSDFDYETREPEAGQGRILEGIPVDYDVSYLPIQHSSNAIDSRSKSGPPLMNYDIEQTQKEQPGPIKVTNVESKLVEIPPGAKKLMIQFL